MNTHNAKPESAVSVNNSREKAVTRELGIEHLEPIVVSLERIDLRHYLSKKVIDQFRAGLQNFVGYDTECYDQGGTSAAATYQHHFRIFETGAILHAVRYRGNWRVWFDPEATPKVMMDGDLKRAIQKFIGDKTVMYYGNNYGD